MKRINKYESTKNLVRSLESVFEVIIFSFAYYISWRRYYFTDGMFPYYASRGKYILMGIYFILAFILLKNMDGFRFGDLRRLDLCFAQWIGIFMTNFITYFQLCLIANTMISPLPMLALTVVDAILIMMFVFIYCFIYRKVYAPHKMIMVYGADSAISLKIKMDTRRDKYRVKKMISTAEGFDKICEEIIKFDAVVLNDIEPHTRNDILKFCYENQIRVYLAPKITDVIMKYSKTISIFDTPLYMVKGTGLSLMDRFFKRLFDIILCILVLIPATPFMLIIALAIKLEDGGPVFYKQKRVTIGGNTFDILKFRSMIVNAEELGISIPATGNDPRITKVGKVIRAMRIDELPQILNILKGDMSIVGPRPERVEHVEKYTELIPEFKYRLKVKGGLTGYAQIYGKYNTSAYDKLRMDLMYIEGYSFLLDLKLIITTIRILFSKESTEGFEKQDNQQTNQ